MKTWRWTLMIMGTLVSWIGSAAESEKTIAALKNLSGCFKVTFEFVEDGAHDYFEDSLKAEWVSFEEKNGMLTLRHVGVVEDKKAKEDQAFIHWREEWRAQNDGTWTQTVFGPFDDFRYTCSAAWNVNQWRCLAKAAPMPRRDKSVGRTYATLDRENTLQVTSKGWIQNENNVKRNKDGTVHAVELGWNKYVRIDDKACALAQKLLNEKN